MEQRRLATRLCWAIDRNDWLITISNALAALAFVAGCIAFYAPSTQTAGITLFLIGSCLWLFAVAADAYRRHGPAD